MIMKFLKLEILNLASLDKREGEVIYFEEGALGESTIFSIVGPTGSGKSTILDAICLALYNRAPRYPRKKNDRDRIEIYGDADTDEKNRLAPTDGRNILSRGKNMGYSKLTFLANNGDVYRAEWHVQKSRIRYNDVVTGLYKIVRKDDGWKEETCTWNDLPKIIGLDYEQFLRTVLIAQGSFANFLTAKESERYELLEKLVGCEDMYACIVKAIKEKKEAAEGAYNEIKAQFAAFEKDDLTPEQLEELILRIRELEAVEAEWKIALEQVKKALEWYAVERNIVGNIVSYENALRQAKNDLEAIHTKVKRLALHDATLEAVEYYKEWKSKSWNIGQIHQELMNLKKDVERRKRQLEEEEERLLHLKNVVMQTDQMWEEQKPRINRARTLKGELDVARKQVDEKWIARNTALKQAENARKALEENLENVRITLDKRKEIERKLDDFKVAFTQEKDAWNVKVLLATSLYLQEEKKLEGMQAEKLQNAKDKAIRNQQDLKDALRVQNEMKNKLETKQTKLRNKVELERENGKIRLILEKLSIGVLKEEVDTLRKTHTLVTSEKWECHRLSLKEGKACPLCGAVNHPYRDIDVYRPVVDDLEKMIQNKEAVLEEQQKIKDDETRKLSINQGILESIEKEMPVLVGELEKLQKDWMEITLRHPDWQVEMGNLSMLQKSVDEEVISALDALRNYNSLSAKVKELRDEKEILENSYKKYVSVAESEQKDLENHKIEVDKALAMEEGKTENLRMQKEEKQKALTQAVEAWKIACEVVTCKQDALKAEIGERDPDTFEQELILARDKAVKIVEEKVEQIAGLKQQLEGVNGSILSHETLFKKETDACSVKKLQLDEWLTAYNGMEGHSQKLLLEDIASLSEAKEPWEEIRKEKEAKNRACVSAETTYHNEVSLHSVHQKSKPQKEEQELLEWKAELEGKDNKELVEKKACLLRYETVKEKMGAMHARKQEMERTVADWKAISEAVGGTEGKLLRKIAQCYTLHFLVEHANAEIRKFNSRYELVQVKNSLAIRVIDHDRADDVRDITSLSGGETFIVSLGLALGLSSLSSRSISFGNLFIDEGFGTLDPDTLATVIDSLAMLQTSQGKKVGVISHTDTMSERITTQIRVVKNGNTGSSHIEVYP